MPKSYVDELLDTRLEGLRRTLTTTDRVLSGRGVELTFDRAVVPPGTFPGKSMGDRITISLGVIPNLGSSSALVHILGVNYHEVAHVRYGVGPENLKPSGVQHPRFMEAYRVIEEHRVETLLAAKYAKMKKYFAYPVIEHFVKDRGTWPVAFLYTHGRRYLPMKIRDTFRGIFNKKYGGVKEFSQVIDEYRVLVFTTEDRLLRGADLVNQFAALLEKYKLPPLSSHDSTSNRSGESTKDFSDNETEEEGEQAASQTEEQDSQESQGEDGSKFSNEEDEDEEGSDGEPEDGDGENSPNPSGTSAEGDEGDEPESQGSGSGQDQEEGDSQQGSGSGSGSGDDDYQQGSGDQGKDGHGGQDDKSDGSPGSSGKGGTGTGKGKRSRRSSRQELRQQEQELQGDMSDALETVLASESVQNDVENLRAAMEDQASLSSSLQRHENSDEVKLKPVTQDMLREADRLKEVMRQIWAQMEPGWEYGLSEGNRLDMGRAALAQSADDYDSIYCDWIPGQQENAGAEFVILADESGSMNEPVNLPGEEKLVHRMKTTKATVVSRQVWELVYALQEIEAHVTVIAFESQGRTLYDRSDRVTTNGYVHLIPRGGTQPAGSLKEASRILNMSEMKNKMLIVISDGSWDGMYWSGGSVSYEETLDMIEGVVKVAVLVDSDDSGYQFTLADKFHVVHRTNGPVFDVMAEATTKLMERNMQ